MRRGFTLIELLIVMAILTVMMAIIVVSAGTVTATQVAMATKDSLRLMRYARNMALQTQQPVTIAFAPGSVTLESAFDDEFGSTTALPSETDKAAATTDDEEAPGQRVGNALIAGDIEAVGLVKHYEGVGFEFVCFDDSIRMGRSADNEKTDFNRRVAGESDEAIGERQRQKSETFSVTVRANGTTRPFTLRVYELEGAEDAGNYVTFDFLCSGTIGEDRP